MPLPVSVKMEAGNPFSTTETLTISASGGESWREHLLVFGKHWFRLTGGLSRVEMSDSKDVRLIAEKRDGLGEEGYELDISETRIRLAASSLKGLAHGTATLMQLVGGADGRSIQPVSIADNTPVGYRSVMLDLGRNPHSLALLKETVDFLWFYKIDSLHLHLTDDQRIAFPSMAFPKVWDGLITAEQFSELESYAFVRGVTLIPELEVPGHSGLLRRHYPEVFGQEASDLAQSESAFQGIKTILDEMIAIFTSTPYVHIGGDEAFGVPEELQRDLINRLHAYLKSRGRQTLVWEGPRPGAGENRVNREVIHMNWRTINYPADQMLRDGHRVVNAAWDPLYVVDHYPRINFTMTTPQHLYESLSLTRFKHVNPGISTYAEPIEVEPNEQLIGFCMPWWEGREVNFLRQMVPRMIPYAAASWAPSRKRDYEKFAHRSLSAERTRLAAFYPVLIEAEELSVASDGVFANETTVRFELSVPAATPAGNQLRYTLDGTEPDQESTLYQEPFKLSESTVVRVGAFVEGQLLDHGTRLVLTAVKPESNLALGKPVRSSVSSGSPFSVERLTDGGTGNLDFYLGYPAVPEPIEITIDLERVETVGQVKVFAYTVSGSFERYTVEVSQDGRVYEEVASRLEKPDKPESSVTHRFEPREVRYVRVRSYGNRGYVFDAFSKLVEVQVSR